jgi:hypothetical protein
MRLDNVTISVIPEPQSLALFGWFALIAWNFRRRRGEGERGL